MTRKTTKGDTMLMPFGRYRGVPVYYIPHQYLLWVLDTVEDLSPTLKSEIRQILGIGDRRHHHHHHQRTPAIRVDTARLEMREIIGSWYRDACRRHHPDHGGSNERQSVVNECYETLINSVQTLGAPK
jgi:hypothetical protein